MEGQTGSTLKVTGSDFFDFITCLKDSQCDINLMRTIIKQIILIIADVNTYNKHKYKC